VCSIFFDRDDSAPASAHRDANLRRERPGACEHPATLSVAYLTEIPAIEQIETSAIDQLLSQAAVKE
jgi:hypothetical protein